MEYDYKKLVEQIAGYLSNCKRIKLGEMVGAPWPYNHSGPMVYTDPDAVLLDQSINAITDLLARAEAAEAEKDKAVTLLGLSKGFLSLHEEIAYWRERAEMLESANRILSSRIAEAEKENWKLRDIMAQIRKTDHPEKCTVVYEMTYLESLSQEQLENVASSVFRALMKAAQERRNGHE